MNVRELGVFFGLNFICMLILFLVSIFFSHTPLIEVAVMFCAIFSAIYVIKKYPENILVIFSLFVLFVVFFHLFIAFFNYSPCEIYSEDVDCNCVGLKNAVNYGSSCIGYRSTCVKDSIEVECGEIDENFS